MNKAILFTLSVVALVAVFTQSEATAAGELTTPGAQTGKIVESATAFLNVLEADQRAKVQFPFIPQPKAVAAKFARTGAPGGAANHPHGNGGPHAGPGNADGGGGNGQGKGPGGGAAVGFSGFVGEQYGAAVWSNFPVGDVPRPGLRLGSLTPTQQDAAMRLLATALSPSGYRKVLDIMGSDQALSETGTPFCSGIACYTIGIFGKPDATEPWMLEFGGHHLALNITVAGKHGVITPALTGAQPAVYTANGKTVRALAQENDKAFALLNALTTAQREKAILNYRVGDLVLGPGHDGEQIEPEGLKASAMNGRQQVLLLAIISEWAGMINEAYAPSRLAEIKAGLADTWFAWSGATTHDPGKNGSAYYRIQGPRLFIEFSPQGVGGDRTMHVHTIYRDPANDYGRAFTSSER